MGYVHNAIIDKLFPGNNGVSQFFGTQSNGNWESGIDVALNTGAPVPLVQPSTFLGDIAGGYVAEFQGQKTGQIDYYQHIQANPNLQVGASYGAGTVIGVIAPGGNYDGYKSSPGNGHLEFGTASSATPGSQYPTYTNTDPLPELAAALAPGGTITSKSASTPPQTPVLGGIGDTLGWIGHQADNLAGVTVDNPAGNVSYGAVGKTIGNALGGTYGGYLMIGLFGLAGIALLYALVNGGK